MGVTGLWRLIEPTGKPVPVETLENKVLAVDISIWLHQMVKGYQDAKGAPMPNAHLMGLFQRLCKLLYFRIKPVFIFDGAFPELKKETIAKRQDSKSRYNSESERLKRELAILLGKKTAITSILGKQISPKKGKDPSHENDDDLFKLPSMPQVDEQDSELDEDESNSSGSITDLHSVDLESDKFKNLNTKEKYDLLIELKETRKMNSWGKLHELPKKSDNFSDFQMQRLLKRRKVQECLAETEKEMGSSGMSLNELESLLNEEGIDTKIESLPTRRIASDETTRFILINNVKQALADAKKRKMENENNGTQQTVETKPDEKNNQSQNDELEEDLQKAIQMSLECVDEPNTSTNTINKTEDSWTSNLSDSGSEYSYSGPDSEEDDGFEEPDNLSTAKAYIMQYTDYTHKAIEKLINNKNSTVKAKPHCSKVDDILSELQNEKPVITHNIELSSDEENALNESGLTKSHEKIKPDQVVDLNTTDETHNEIHVTAPTQSSVILVENTETEVITLDSSAILSDVNDCQKVPLETTNVNFSDLKPISLKTELFNFSETNLISDSDSSEEDFEEVSVLVSPKKSEPVVELVLNVGEAPQDDIFADIFTETVKDQNILPNVFEHKNIKVEHDDEDEFNHENFNTAIDEHSILEEKQEGRIDFLPNQQAKEKVVSSISTESQGSTKSNVEAEFNQNNINAPVNTSQNPNESGSNVSVKSSKDVSSHIPDEKQLNSVVSLTEIPKKIIPEEHIDSVEATKETPKRVISEEQLNCMVEQIQTEEQDLLQEKRRFDRIGRNITEQMTKEAQELLQIFGIPYIVAPMEAEAQCAFLENVKLTDGTITDDSDVWLFGGRTVYKNFFNQKKHVLQFLSERIERSFNLNREQLILLALLVGSDYTTGVTGVGPVTALEILASFPFNKKQVSNETTKQGRSAHIVSGLQEFKKWVRSGKRTDDTNLKKKLRNVKITDDFPSVRVVQAYLDPNVEKNDDKFTWGELDLTVLRDYTKSKFGWSQNKLDEIMKPVLKRIQDRTSQRTLQDYFKRKLDFHSLEDQMSKRVKAAVQKMGPDDDKKNPEHVFLEPEKPKAAKRKKSKATEGESSKNNKELAQKKQKKAVVNDELASMLVKVKSHAEPDNVRSDIAIKIPKSDRFQEIIPQREKDKQCLLQNKMKAIEVFRKTTIDRKKQTRKRRPNLPKDKADLSESDSD